MYSIYTAPFSLDSIIVSSLFGEGNGNPLQYSCLENPRDRGAWWAAAYGVVQSRTRLMRLSSSSSSSNHIKIEKIHFKLICQNSLRNLKYTF